MRHFLFLFIASLAFVSCGNRGNNKAADNAGSETAVQAVDESTVYVYYFHGKQRCKTCIAVEKVAETTIPELYGEDSRVRYVEVQTDDEANKALVEKYEVTWNALIIAKGNDHVEITKQAFAHAVNSPEVLTELIKTEVDKRLAK